MTVLNRISDLPKFYVATQALLIVAALAGFAASQVLAPPAAVWGSLALVTALAGMVSGAAWTVWSGEMDRKAALASWGGTAVALAGFMLWAAVWFAFIAPELAP